MKAPGGEQGLQVFGEKIEVFEEAEEPQIEEDAPIQDVLSSPVTGGSVEHFADIEIYGCGDEDESQKSIIPSRVKSVAGDEKEGILRTPRQPGVDQPDEGEEKAEFDCVKKHRVDVLLRCYINAG